MIQDMVRQEYHILRKICGAYHGSGHLKLGLICNTEPSHIIVEENAKAWAILAVRSTNPLILRVQNTHLPNTSPWYSDV